MSQGVKPAPPVIFVCGRNAVRSPMAEALWRAAFGPGAEAASCGVEPAGYADGFMVAVMEEAGFDLSDYEPRDMHAMETISADLVVCLAPEAHEAAARIAADHGAALQLWPAPDPAETRGGREAKLAAYRQAREAIAARIAQFGRESGYLS